ncbi:hypothetical protein U9M48_028861 [Paspalum notatum var. saurae]|uniref:Uncharacterized protein n=1 Tax=Paspalum notatum var. saurae TaxID=547442 RepID=A0AAQ3TZK6_PASNO
MTPLYVHQLFALTPLSSRSMLFGTASPLHGANSFRHRTSSLLRPSSLFVARALASVPLYLWRRPAWPPGVLQIGFVRFIIRY